MLGPEPGPAGDTPACSGGAASPSMRPCSAGWLTEHPRIGCSISIAWDRRQEVAVGGVLFALSIWKGEASGILNPPSTLDRNR